MIPITCAHRVCCMCMCLCAFVSPSSHVWIPAFPIPLFPPGCPTLSPPSPGFGEAERWEGAAPANDLVVESWGGPLQVRMIE